MTGTIDLTREQFDAIAERIEEEEVEGLWEEPGGGYCRTTRIVVHPPAIGGSAVAVVLSLSGHGDVRFHVAPDGSTV